MDFSPVNICRNCNTIKNARDLVECCENPQFWAARVFEEKKPVSHLAELIAAGPAFPFRFFLLDSIGDLHFKESISAEETPQKIQMIPIEKIISDELTAICINCGRVSKSPEMFSDFAGGRPGFKALNFCGGVNGCGSSQIMLTGPKLPPVVFADRVKSISVDQISGVAYALTISGRFYKIKPTISGIKISDDKGNEIFHNTTKREISKA